LIDQLKAWIPRLKQIRNVRSITYFDSGDIKIDVAEKETGYEPYLYMKNYDGEEVKEFVPIRPTGFPDINGDPERMLREGDVLVFNALGKLKYGVITWNKSRGQWALLTETSSYELYLWLEWGAKHAGDVWHNRGLVPWWKEDQTDGSNR
jgi:hypothetical protein